jgi:para-nitrobenzyl esterase
MGPLAATRSVVRSPRPLGDINPPFLPVVDGELVPAVLTDPAAVAGSAGIDLLIGATADEASAWLASDPRVTSTVRRRQLIQAVTHSDFHRPIDDYVRARRAHAGRTHVYRFTWQPPDDASPLGATHCIELPFLLGDEPAWAAAPMLGNTARPDPRRAAPALGRLRDQRISPEPAPPRHGRRDRVPPQLTGSGGRG